MKGFLNILCFVLVLQVGAQNATVSKVWVADKGNGTYRNPILHADYSDPDAVRVGEDYYMISSSFEAVPGIPILHSKDLVNWKLIGHVLPYLTPQDHFSVPHHGEGVWAPSIRYHKSEFYIYYPDPDFGIYLTKAKKAEGPWSTPVLVAKGKGLIDPCPLWDEDGQAYLVHAFAGSRAGIKSVLVIKKMNAESTATIDEGVIVYDGHEEDPTLEGPKLYKRNGYYYIFAPAGGVSTGWQLALRSKNVYGPYERKLVMDQGSTQINGPHQGAWVTTPLGEDWFLHFQDKEAYGRVVHLQPMKWRANWPVMGVDKNGDGKGEPVLAYKKPATSKAYAIQTPAESDEFNSTQLGLQWQWMANPKSTWAFTHVTKGSLRLYTQWADSGANIWMQPHVLSQKFPAETFMVTTKLKATFNPKLKGEKVGLAILGLSTASLHLKSGTNGATLIYEEIRDAKGSKRGVEKIIENFLPSGDIYLRVKVAPGGLCTFSYSFDGVQFTKAGGPFTAMPGQWTGAKVGLFASRETTTNDAGYADFDWFRIEPVQ